MRFGMLTYQGTNNLGDEIQSLAALRFLPAVDHHIDRDRIGYFRSDDPEPVAVILNGWFSHAPESWPPARPIVPLLTSMHLSGEAGAGMSRLSAEDFFLRPPAVDYLRQHGPVGARDLHTLELLRKADVPAYFSGCLTLTLERDPGAVRGDDVVVNDVPDEVLSRVRQLTRRQVVVTTHDDAHTRDPEERRKKARALLALYQSAHCVITTRLHCALPCLALGTPVLLLDTARDQSRFVGLNQLLRHGPVDAFLSGHIPFDVERPAGNREDYLLLRANLEETVRAFFERAQARAAAAETSELPSTLRFQTLLHVYVETLDRLAGVEEKARQAAAARAQLDDELKSDRERLARLIDEHERLSARARADAAARVELEERLGTLIASSEWRVVLALKHAARRFPWLADRVNQLLQGRPKR